LANDNIGRDLAKSRTTTLEESPLASLARRGKLYLQRLLSCAYLKSITTPVIFSSPKPNSIALRKTPRAAAMVGAAVVMFVTWGK
jgi:hypothetical protein